jgi:transcriptional regulator with XRE-family HTH domain
MGAGSTNGVAEPHSDFCFPISQALREAESIGALVNIGVNTVNRIELNETEPHMSTIRKLARALGVEPRRLVKGGGDA